MSHIAPRREYGVPRATAELRRSGRVVNRKRVERVIREHGTAGNSRRTGRLSLTKATPSLDLAGREATAARPARPSALFVAVVQQGELVLDGRGEPLLVAGGEEVEQGAPQYGQGQGAAGGTVFAVAFGRQLAAGQDSGPRRTRPAGER